MSSRAAARADRGLVEGLAGARTGVRLARALAAVFAVLAVMVACAPATSPDATGAATGPGASGTATDPGGTLGASGAPGTDPAVRPPDPADPAALVCWGDSLSYAICEPGAGGFLQAALADRTVINRAISGQTSTQIAVRMGAYPLTVTFPGDELPASGRVDVQIDGVPDGLGALRAAAVVGGVEGVLANHGLFGAWTFERSTSGEAVHVAAGTPIALLDADARAHPGFVWVGRNNVSQTEQIIADVAAMVAAHEAVSDQPLWVVGVTPARDEVAGTSGAAAIAEVNAALRSAYGDRYLPMDEYLRDDALGAIGVTPSAADLDAAARGVIPPSLMDSDGLHFNESGNRAISQYLASALGAG